MAVTLTQNIQWVAKQLNEMGNKEEGQVGGS